MFIATSALLFLCAFLEETSQTANGVEAERLYRQAAEAIADNAPRRAVEPLRALMAEHPDSELARIAAYHLAECYLHTQQPLEAYELWLAFLDTPDGLVANGRLGERDSHDLLRQIIRGLPKDQTTGLLLANTYDQQAGEAPSSSVLLRVIAEELVRRHAADGDYQVAVKWLQRAQQCEAETTTLEPDAAYRLPLRWARSLHHSEDYSGAAELLKASYSLETLSTDRQVPIRFLLMESLIAAREFQSAAQQLQQLQRLSHELADSSAAWDATLALRQCELLVDMRRYAEAEQELLQARERYPDFDRCYEFDYLMARCALAGARLDEALQHLEDSTASPTAKSTAAVPRARWMQGEVRFLQRDYRSALEYYKVVEQMEQYPEWQARALFQHAKCQELLGQPEQAQSRYRQLLKHFSDSPASSAAAARLAAIQQHLQTLPK